MNLHVHVFGFAIFDLILTVIAAFVAMLVIRKYVTGVSVISHSLLFGIILLVLLCIAEYVHKMCDISIS